MKKTLILVSMLLILTSMFAVLLNEGFEGTTFPPDEWTVFNGGDAANTWIRSTTAPHGGTGCAAIHWDTATAHDDWLITPRLRPEAGSNTLTIWAKNGLASFIDQFNVKLSTTSNATTDFSVTLASNVGPGITWTSYTYDLSAYNGLDVYVAFQAVSLDMFYLYLDDISGINLTPGAANDLQAVSITGSTEPVVNTLTPYTINIRNRGTVTQTDYTVKLMSGTTVLASVAGPSIEADATIPVIVNYSFPAQGPITVFGQVVLAGDANTTNDVTQNLSVVVQPPGTVVAEIGTGVSVQRMPFGIFYGFERDASIYTADEIGVNGALTSIKWYCGTAGTGVAPYKIYLKTTNDAVLTASPWATMIADATLMQTGTYTFSTTGWVTFTFANPYAFLNSNLMVLVETNYTGGGVVSPLTYPYFRYTTATTNKHMSWSADTSAPTGNGTVNMLRPNIGLFFNTAGYGSLNGTITANGNPLDGATVSIVGTQLTTNTSAAGTYNFPYVAIGAQQVTCSKVGYNSQTLPVTIVENQPTTQDFVMVQLPTIEVTGRVVGSDAPTIGISGATVALAGMAPYTATTDAQGLFTIAGVYGNQTYTYTLTKTGYQSTTGSITVGLVNYSTGDLTISETTYPATGVQAVIAGANVNLTWTAPNPNVTNFTDGFETYADFALDFAPWVNLDIDLSEDTYGYLDGYEWDNIFFAQAFQVFNPSATTPAIPATAFAAHTGSKMAACWAAYTPPNNDWLISPQITVPANGVVKFWARALSPTYPENFKVGVSTTGTVPANFTIISGAAAVIPTTTWAEYTYQLNAYAGQPVRIGIQCTSNDAWSLFIDDFFVGVPTIASNSAPLFTKKSQIPTYNNIIGSRLAGHANPVTRVSVNSNQVVSFDASRTDRPIIGYKVWRFLVGQETNVAAWQLITTSMITTTDYQDAGWSTVADGNYKWAVRAIYTNDVMSDPALSNAVLKYSSVNVTGLVVGSDAPTVGLADATVSLNGITTHTATTNAQGQFSISGVYTSQTYTYSVTKVGYSTVTGSITIGTTDYVMPTITINELTIPANTVVASENVQHTAVSVTWSAPGTGGGDWIQWDSGQNDDAIGSQGASSFDAASRWPSAELSNYVGMSVYAVRFFRAANATFRVRVWTGGSVTAPATMVYDQPVTTTVVGDWVTATINPPIPIVAGQELWFGYNVVYGAAVYAAGVDEGPCHNQMGNMIYSGNAWTTLYNANPDLNSDWNLAAYLGWTAPTINNEPVRSSVLSELTRNSSTSVNMNRNSRALLGYKVWRLLEGQESNEAAWTLLTPNTISAAAYNDAGWASVADGTYKWAVKAVYSSDVMALPAFSNSVPRLTQIGTLTGTVTHGTTPIAGATITVGTYTSTTNASGVYSMIVPAGIHTVTCSADGYITATENDVLIVNGESTTQNFNLAVSVIFTDGFETYEDFLTDFAPWVNDDVDASVTYGIQGVEFPGSGDPMAFIIFNQASTTPALTTAPAHGGLKQAACFADNAPPNDDWLISQRFEGVGTNARFGFWARAFSASYAEKFTVGLSTQATLPSMFTIISGATPIQAPTTWTHYQYDIPASYVGGNLRVGIHCVSNDAFIFLVDDFMMDLGNVAIEDPTPQVVVTSLKGNYPNPFNPETSISYSVKGNQPVLVEIYNTKGQKVKTLVNETKANGNHSVKWNGTDDNNRQVTSGVYFYKMNAGTYSSTRKMILMK